MLKKELRTTYGQRRERLSHEEVSEASIAIANQLLKIPIWEFDYYHLFLAITEKKEVDTEFVMSILQGKDKNIILPKMGENRSLLNYLLTDSTVIRKNSWNVPEPQDGIEVPALKLDVVFLPLLAFDLQGNRVGYGKGYYDILLQQCRPNVIKVGLSLFEAEEKITDINPKDVPLDFCVTPQKIYSF